MAGKPAEAGGGRWVAGLVVLGNPAFPVPLLSPRFSGPLQALAASADFSFLRMVFGLLPICWLCLVSSVRCWEGYIHPLFAGACGSLTCCAVRRLPEGISAPAASPVVQFP